MTQRTQISAPSADKAGAQARPAQRDAAGASAQHGLAALPASVQNAVAAPGQPLDAQTRSLFEPRFGHDFSKVRVHTNPQAAQSAREAGALAYTVGNDVVFGSNQYQPRTGMGRVVIAHELAHTIQQKQGTRSSSTEDGGMEREASYAAAAAVFQRPVALPSGPAPPIQFLRVTEGALGHALETFTKAQRIPDKAILLLRRSPTFMKLAAIVDKNFVWRVTTDEVRERGPDGRILSGSAKGKRELPDVLQGNAEVEPFEAPPEAGTGKTSGDQMMIKSTDVFGFISEVAHETAHLAQLVDTSAPPAQNIVDEVNGAIRNEVGARTAEANVLSEIPGPGASAQAAKVGSRKPAEVERDISPAFGMTYVENAFFGARLREARYEDGISEADAEQIRTEIEKEFQGKKLPKEGFHFKQKLTADRYFELSDYGEVWFSRRMVQAEWKKFEESNKPTDPDYADEKEKLVQDHASRFFEGRVTYQPRP